MVFISLVPPISVNVQQYGADPTGTNDATTAIQNAINAASTNGTISFPPGTYSISSPLTVTAQGQCFLGLGLNSIIKASASFSGAALLTNTGYQQGIVQNLKFLGGNNFTVSSNPACDAIKFNSDCADWVFSNLYLKSFNGWGIELIDGASGAIGYAFLDNVNARNCKAGFHFQSSVPATQRGGGIMMTNCVADNTQGGDAFFLDQITDSCFSNCQGYAPTTGSNSLHIKGCGFCYLDTFDLGGGTPASPCILMEAGQFPNDHITLQNMLIQKGTPGLKITGGADHTRINNCDVYFNVTHGIEIDNSTSNGAISISSCQFFQNNTSAAATTYDIENLDTHGHVLVEGCQFTNNGGTTLSASIDSTSTATVQDCHFYAGYGAFSANKPSVIRGCPGYNPVGFSVTQPAVAASGVAMTNNSGVDCTVYVSGGTLTAITVGGSATGITAAAAAGSVHAVDVPANQTIAYTYTVAPTHKWFGR